MVLLYAQLLNPTEVFHSSWDLDFDCTTWIIFFFSRSVLYLLASSMTTSCVGRVACETCQKSSLLWHLSRVFSTCAVMLGFISKWELWTSISTFVCPKGFVPETWLVHIQFCNSKPWCHTFFLKRKCIPPETLLNNTFFSNSTDVTVNMLMETCRVWAAALCFFAVCLKLHSLTLLGSLIQPLMFYSYE